jgi:predicted PhzF superfamily epimerase YddE/YHI9
VLKAKNYLCVFDDLRDVAALQPDLARLTAFCRSADAGVIATSPGNEKMGWDCASRFFAPNVGIPEDPVTGSAHTTIVPFWAKRLNKADVTARQISKRGGTLFCTLQEDRLLMRGRAADYLKGTISV